MVFIMFGVVGLKRIVVTSVIVIIYCLQVHSKDSEGEGSSSLIAPIFKHKIVLPASSVKDQYNSGTCWSFSTISMIESELMRMGKPSVDLSEMFVVRNVYSAKGKRYVRMHGKINFGAGGAFNDVTDIIREYGIVPEAAYRGKMADSLKHDHTELDLFLKNYLNSLLESSQKSLNPLWEMGYSNVLDTYLGTYPELFAYDGEMFTPRGFSRELGIVPDNYVLITSFTHHPYYKKFILEVPDNWSWGEAYNVPLDELVEIADAALKSKYTFVWASDISEDGYSFKRGMALAPEFMYKPQLAAEYNSWKKSARNIREDQLFGQKTKINEIEVTQRLRQKGFDNLTTTDDHSMHVTGLAYDQFGKKYYYIKNSWGTDNAYKGYMYISDAYFRLKTISIMVHKDAIPGYIKKELNLR